MGGPAGGGCPPCQPAQLRACARHAPADMASVGPAHPFVWVMNARLVKFDMNDKERDVHKAYQSRTRLKCTASQQAPA
eukprot:355073-Chlamydomonas_euryale.AAC.4